MAFPLVLLDGDAQQHALYLPGDACHILQLLTGHAGLGPHGQRHRHHGDPVPGVKFQRGHHFGFGQHFGLAFAFKNTGIDGGGIHAAFHDLRSQPQRPGRGIGKAEPAGIGDKAGIDALGYFAGNGQPDGLNDGGDRLGTGPGLLPQAGLGGIIAVAGVVVNAEIHHMAVLFLQAAQHPGGGHIHGHHIFHRPVQYPAGGVIPIQIVILLRQGIGAQHPYLLA